MTLSGSLNETKSICPHCWHGFYPDEACYISNHPEFIGDSVAGESEYRRFAPHEISTGRGGEPLDPKGWKITERACPRCHLQIPSTVLQQRPYFVSVVGAPRSGKTYFLTSMVHGLRKELTQFFGLNLNDSDSHEVKAFLAYEKELFYPTDPQQLTFLHKTLETGSLYNHVTLDGVQIQLPKPFIFTLRPTGANPNHSKLKFTRNLVLYDNAGESFEFLKEKSGNSRVTQHLTESDAVLFNFDPLQCPGARVKFAAVSSDPQVSSFPIVYRQETILSEVANRIRRHRSLSEQDCCPSLLAVCVQKFDVWKSLLPHAEDTSADGGSRSLIDHASIAYFERVGIGGLDVEEINWISLLVRAFVQDLCPEFVALAESTFKKVRYFPVSALGTSPEIDQSAPAEAFHSNLLKVRPAQIQPFRVTHPMLWLLNRWNLISRTTRTGDRSTKFPNGSVQSVSGDQLRVVSPYSNRVIILDREYANSLIYDPFVGKPIWIPAVKEATTRPPATPAASTASQPAAKPAAPPPLELDPSQKQPRRGWFRT